ncbi:Uncharacterised protein [Candidatus Bilamarchaeum dharawalense]|uniref:Tetratricopeptide repeat protein n=1 Tax=Candidatus Bilamarchaeum dharawalense TaxID=2885759 RepID=A0A5E4LM68_9ARCH|nr:Uncharacterised protein [Candidatus Bilamarchaeum dharawalense]
MTTIASTSWFPFAYDRPNSRFLSQAKNFIEKLKESVAFFSSPEEKVGSVVEATTKFVENYLGKRTVKPTLEVVVASSTREWAEARARGYEFPTKKYKSTDDFIQKCLDDPKKGTYDNNFSRLVINLEAIEQAHKGNEKEQTACLIGTTIHELLHHLGGFEDFHRLGNHSYDLLWIIEGTNELLTRDMMEHMHADENRNLKCTSGSTETSLAMKLENIVGHDTLTVSYFEGNFFPVRMKMKEEGLNEDEINKILRLGHNFVNAPESKKARIAAQLDTYLDTLDKRRNTRRRIEERPNDPGMSQNTIDSVKSLLGEGREDEATRAALVAALIIKWEGEEPTARKVFDLIADTHTKSNGILADMFRGLSGRATAMIPVGSNMPSFFQHRLESAGHYGISPQPDRAIDGQDTIPEMLSQSGGVMEGLKLGTEINYETAKIVEVAAVDYMINHGGQLPTASELARTLVEHYEKTAQSEAILPSPQMVTTQILDSVMSSVNERTLTKEETWVREPAVEFAKDLGISDYAGSVFNASYEGNGLQVGGILDGMPEFSGYGMVVAEKCNEFYQSMGVQPTCGDIVGLAMTSVAIAQDAQLPQAVRSEINFPEVNINPDAIATLMTVTTFKDTIRSEARNDFIQNPVAPTGDTLGQFWENKGYDVAAQQNLTTATRLFVSAIRVEQPATKLVAKDSVIVAIGPDGTVKRPGDGSYLDSLGLVGATATNISDALQHKPVELPQQVLQRVEIAKSLSEADLKAFGEITELPTYAQDMASELRSSYQDPYERCYALFEIMKDHGKFGIEGNMFLEDRKGGSKSIPEVFTARKANCLELTLAYCAMAKVALADKPDVKIVPLDVVNIYERIEVGHACVGILLTDPKVKGSPDFNADWDFRKNVLHRYGIEDNPNLKLLVVDPVNSLFDFSFNRVRPLESNEALSLFHSNSGSYAEKRGDKREAAKCYAEAERLWPENPRMLLYTACQSYESDPDAAVEVLQKIDSDHRNSTYYTILGNLLYNRNERNRSKDRNAVIACYDKAVELDKTNTTALIMKAQMHMENGTTEELEKAKTTFLTAIGVLINIKRTGTNNQDVAGRMAKLADFDLQKGKTITVTERLDEAYKLLAVSNLALGKVQDALTACRTGRLLHPRNSLFRTMEAVATVASAACYERSGDSNKMRELLCEAQHIAAEINRDDPESFWMNFVDTYVSKRLSGKLDDKPIFEFRVGGKKVLPDDKQMAEIMENPNQSCSQFVLCFIYVFTATKVTYPLNEWESRLKQPTYTRSTRPVRTYVRQDIFEKGGDARARLKVSALKKTFERRKREAATFRAITDSQLDPDEKMVLNMLVREDNRAFVATALIGLYHPFLMKSLGKVAGHEYARKTKEVTNNFTKQSVGVLDMIALARAGLGPDFAKECEFVVKCLSENPLDLDRHMLKTAVGYAKLLGTPTEPELLELTKTYATLIGLSPTNDNVQRLLPKVRNLLLTHRLPYARPGLIDPTSVLFL